MNRRDFLKVLSAAAIVAGLPKTAIAALDEAATAEKDPFNGHHIGLNLVTNNGMKLVGELIEAPTLQHEIVEVLSMYRPDNHPFYSRSGYPPAIKLKMLPVIDSYLLMESITKQQIESFVLKLGNKFSDMNFAFNGYISNLEQVNVYEMASPSSFVALEIQLIGTFTYYSN